MNTELLFLAQCNFTALVQRIFNGGEISNTFLLLVKYWKFWCTDYITLTKSSMMDVRQCVNGRDTWVVNHYSECQYGFIGLVQTIFNCDKIPNTSLTLDSVQNMLIHRLHFCVIPYRSYDRLKMAQLLAHPRVDLHLVLRFQHADYSELNIP